MIVYYVQFSREDSHSAELESRKALEKKVHISDTCINRDMCDYIFYIICIQTSGSSTDSVDSLYRSFYRQFSRLSSTASSLSVDEDTGYKISKSEKTLYIEIYNYIASAANDSGELRHGTCHRCL